MQRREKPLESTVLRCYVTPQTGGRLPEALFNATRTTTHYNHPEDGKKEFPSRVRQKQRYSVTTTNK